MSDYLQEEYDWLESEIESDHNHILIESQRKRFYELHTQLKIKDKDVLFKQIDALIDQKRQNYKFFFGDNEYEEEKVIFDFLKEKIAATGLDRLEYNFLTYLMFKNSFSLKINTPQLPEIIPTSFILFFNQFAFNNDRKYLFEIFNSSLKTALALYNVENLTLLIGGGYLDMKNSQPSDIDFIILLPEKVVSKDFGNRVKRQIVNKYNKRVDFWKLPFDYDSRIYMAYELLTLISNDSDLVKQITNNHYTHRKIFSLNYPEKGS